MSPLAKYIDAMIPAVVGVVALLMSDALVPATVTGEDRKRRRRLIRIAGWVLIGVAVVYAITAAAGR